MKEALARRRLVTSRSLIVLAEECAAPFPEAIDDNSTELEQIKRRKEIKRQRQAEVMFPLKVPCQRRLERRTQDLSRQSIRSETS